jgi:hypothetical protein
MKLKPSPFAVGWENFFHTPNICVMCCIRTGVTYLIELFSLSQLMVSCLCPHNNFWNNGFSWNFICTSCCWQHLRDLCKYQFSLYQCGGCGNVHKCCLMWGVEILCKIIPVTGRGGPQGCETLRLTHFLDNWLTDGSEVVSFMHQLPFAPRKIPGTLFN